MGRIIGLDNQIVMFFHCANCMKELPMGKSPREWASLEVGFTPIGLQVWCKRHEKNVIHIDFEGNKHPAAGFNFGDRRETPHGRN